MHRPHAHVADEQEREAVERAQLLARRVEVGQDLGRVLAPAVAAVDHRDRRPAGGLGRRALLEVAHRDDVAVVLEHVHRVLDRLLVEVAGARVLRVGEAEHVAAEPVHRGLGGEAGAGARLVEGRQQRLVGEQVGVLPAARDRLELVAHSEDVLELGALKALERQDVAPGEAPHRRFLPFGVCDRIAPVKSTATRSSAETSPACRSASRPASPAEPVVQTWIPVASSASALASASVSSPTTSGLPPVVEHPLDDGEPVVGLVVEDAVGDAVRLAAPTAT